MPVYMSTFMNAVNNPVCVCVYVRKTPESCSSVLLYTRQYRLLLNKNGLSMSMRKLDSWICTHTRAHRVIVYICLQHSLMTTCRPASVLILIYVLSLQVWTYRPPWWRRSGWRPTSCRSCSASCRSGSTSLRQLQSNNQ